ncbi:MAG: methyltransferase domain-containing protein [Mycobacteriaceae bacterium]
MADWDGQEYDDVSALQRSMAALALTGLTLQGSERLLDVGCGDGFVTLQLAARLPGGSALGVDASPRMIAKARSRAVPDGAQVRFEVADALELPFHGEFDVAVSFNALHWVVDQLTALSGVARSLTPRGRAVIQLVCAGERPSLEAVAMNVCADPAWADRFVGFGAPFIHVEPSRFREISAAAGLTVTDTAVTDHDWDFGSREAFTRWCAVGFSDWTAHLDDEVATRFVGDVVHAYESVAGRPGLFCFTQMRVTLTRTG